MNLNEETISLSIPDTMDIMEAIDTGILTPPNSPLVASEYKLSSISHAFQLRSPSNKFISFDKPSLVSSSSHQLSHSDSLKNLAALALDNARHVKQNLLAQKQQNYMLMNEAEDDAFDQLPSGDALAAYLDEIEDEVWTKTINLQNLNYIEETLPLTQHSTPTLPSIALIDPLNVYETNSLRLTATSDETNSLRLRATTSDNQQVSRRFSPHKAQEDKSDEVFIHFPNTSLISIDLSPISYFSHSSPSSIVELSLASNCLTQIDLSPLTSCKSLKIVMLNGNKLTSIDLSPFKDSILLEKLWLNHNELSSLDLSPLSTCPNLRSLYLDHNKLNELSSLELAPLSHCKLLRSLKLRGNSFGGQLNVSSLLANVQLCYFEISPNVTIKATALIHKHSFDLPPAFRKQINIIQWISDQSELTIDSTDLAAYVDQSLSTFDTSNSRNVALVNFNAARYSSAESRLAKHNIHCFSVPSGEILTFSVLKGCQAIVFRVEDTEFDSVMEILDNLRQTYPVIPVFAVGSASSSELLAACLRKGAIRFFLEPITNRDIIVFCSLAFQSSAHQKESSSESPTQVDSQSISQVDFEQKNHLTIHEKDPVGLVPSTEYDALIENIQNKLTLVPNNQSSSNFIPDKMKIKMETAAIKRTFKKVKDKASLNDFSSLVAICGLPACSASFLHEQVCKNARKPVETHVKISEREFNAYWEAKFHNFDQEDRLCQVLSDPEETIVTSSTMKTLIRNLLDKIRPKDYQIDEAILELSYACVLFGFCCRVHDRYEFNWRKLRSHSFCEKLNRAEQGFYEGVFSYLKIESFEGIANTFKKLSKEVGPDSSTQMDILGYINSQHLLLPYTAETLHKTYFYNGITAADFVYLCIATKEPGADSALEYWFKVLDRDMDGRLSVGDALEFYKTKETLMQAEGIVPARFTDIWMNLTDMVFLEGIHEPRQITLNELKVLQSDSRSFFVKSLLFYDDENASINIRLTLEQDVSESVVEKTKA